MKNIFFAFIIFISPLITNASFSRQCDFSAKIEKLDSSTLNSFDVKVELLSRTFKTWILGGSACNYMVGKIFTTSIPLSDEIFNELNSGAIHTITVLRICPDEADGCFLGWRSYRLTEL